jgi:hypothetical protein
VAVVDATLAESDETVDEFIFETIRIYSCDRHLKL